MRMRSISFFTEFNQYIFFESIANWNNVLCNIYRVEIGRERRWFCLMKTQIEEVPTFGSERQIVQ